MAHFAENDSCFFSDELSKRKTTMLAKMRLPANTESNAESLITSWLKH